MGLLEIRDLHASVEGKEILKGVNLTIPAGEIHAIMGPNGSGKSTLSNTIMGHSKYRVTSGDILLDGKSVLDADTDERTRRGLFLCFQYPAELPGVSSVSFLKTVMKNMRGKEVSIKEFKKELKDVMAELKMDDKYVMRSVNDGFSGGEKKRNEIMQMTLMKPKIAILDEVDSGLDIDALRIIAESIQKQKYADRSYLVITHYQRILNYMDVDKIHVFMNGQVVDSGGRELADRLEAEGYDWIEGAGAK